jgi:hypothetical protein
MLIICRYDKELGFGLGACVQIDEQCHIVPHSWIVFFAIKLSTDASS